MSEKTRKSSKCEFPVPDIWGGGVIARDIKAAVPDHNAKMILYCVGGYRSLLSADLIMKMGYTNVESMAGGIWVWREAGHPIDDKELPLPPPCYP